MEQLRIELLYEKEIECIEKICQFDPRYKEWKEETEQQRKQDRGMRAAAVIWAEAVFLVCMIHQAKYRREYVFRHWGAHREDDCVKNVKQAAFYILCHPESEWDKVNEQEWNNIRTDVDLRPYQRWANDYPHNKKKNPWWAKYIIRPVYTTVCCCIMASDIFNSKMEDLNKLKSALSVIKNTMMPLGFEALGLFQTIVTYLNSIYHGQLQNEMDEIFEMQMKYFEENRELREAAEKVSCPFSKEQLALTKLKQAGIWTTAMMQMLDEEERMKKGREFTDEDYCAAFLAVLQCNDEYRNRGEKQYFFKMMSELFGIDCSKSKNVERYVQDNTCDYKKWMSNKKMQIRRKQLAVELEERRKHLLAVFHSTYIHNEDCRLSF